MLFSISHTARENEIKARIGVKGRKKKRNVKVERGDINPLSAIAWWILGKTEAIVAAEPGCFSSGTQGCQEPERPLDSKNRCPRPLPTFSSSLSHVTVREVAAEKQWLRHLDGTRPH